MQSRHTNHDLAQLRIATRGVHGPMSHETLLFPLSSPPLPLFIWFLVAPPHSPHSSHFFFKIMEPHHTAPQSIQSLHASCTHPTPVQYVLLAWLLSHRQTLGCFAVLIIFFIHLDFSFPFHLLVKNAYMSACRGDFQPSRLRHFQVVSRSISTNCLYSRACTYFHFISSLFTFVFFHFIFETPL